MNMTSPALWPRRLLAAPIRAYRFFLSPWLGSSCRLHPTCSAYSLQALQSHGAAAGTYLTLRRLARCHPLCAGGHDPVPDLPLKLFAFLSRGVTAVTDPESPSSVEKNLS
mgnify:CR=1 FL=1